MGEILLVASFALAAFLVFYVYAGYPLLLRLVTGGKRRPVPENLPDGRLPSVTMLIAACNEEEVIRKKLENCLAIDYPADRLQFVIAADGCTDGTPTILKNFEHERVRSFVRPIRMGKINAIASVLPYCHTDLVLFSDANTFYRPDAVRKLVRHFQDEKVGVVTGDVRLLSAGATFSEGEGLYYRYERALQELETAFDSTVAIDGAMYAVRRELIVLPEYREVPDDFVISMNVGKQGYRLVYDREPIATETATPSNGEEFGRKIRIAAHGIQAFRRGEGVPSLETPKLWWAYYSHKWLRWLVPVFLVVALVASIALSFLDHRWLLAAAPQILFYLLALVAFCFPGLRTKAVRVPYYFSMVNLGMLIGLARGFTTGEQVLGMKTSRAPVRESTGD